MYCNRKIVADCHRLMIDSDNVDKFESLVIDKYGIPRTEWTDDSVAPENGVDNMLISK